MRLVGERARTVLQDGVDDAPCLLHAVPAGEQQVLALHRIADQPLVRSDLVRMLVGERKLDVLALEASPTALGSRADRDLELRVEPKPPVVRVAGELLVLREDALRWTVQLHVDLGARDRKLFAGADEPRDAGPPPRIDGEPDRDKRLDVGVRRNALLVAVPA